MKLGAVIPAALALVVTGGVTNAAAQDFGAASLVPDAAFFFGLGGSANTTEFSKQNLYAQGVADIYQAGVLVASGSAGGSMQPSFETAFTFAPAVQLGYFRHFTDSAWLWGAKFSYIYQNADSTEDNLIVPQAGSFTGTSPSTFTGNVVLRSYETRIKHQLALMPLVGRSFERSFVYLGGGPTLSQLEANLNGMLGFAAIDGQHLNITGDSSDFSSEPWVFGGSAIIGATYFLSPSWFVEVSYTFAITARHESDFSAPFSTTTDGYDDIGVLSGNYSGRAITQSVLFSINKAF
jgi:hypothetical protein